MRIVSLCPSLTELVFDLGQGDELVGRTKFCIHPAARVDAVEKVGGTKNPKLERIIELAPDIVLLNEEENRREDAEALRPRASVVTSASRERRPKRRRWSGRSPRRSCAARRRSDRARHRGASRSRRAARPRRAVRYGSRISSRREPWMTANADTFVSALLPTPAARTCSRRTRIAIQRSRRRSSARAKPDVVLLSTEPFPFKPSHADELATLSGVVRDECRSWMARSCHGTGRGRRPVSTTPPPPSTGTRRTRH